MTTNQANTQQGTVSAHPKGFGFLTADSGEEFFVPPPLMRKVVPGDRVECVISESPKKPGQLQASTIRVLERKPSTWQGTVSLQNGRYHLTPDLPCFMPIQVRGIDVLPANCVVSVRSEVSDLQKPLLVARLERVLGDRNRKGFDQDYALARYDFPTEFDAKALKEAAALPLTLTAESLVGRVDLRDVPLVTIDGESTRDYDDAVFGEVLPDGSGTKVLVAIADVSYYVKPGSALNTAAIERATSVYLPGKTVPMLPENLSNGVCSLVPHEDRLVVVAEIILSPSGEVTSHKFYRAVMRSAARLTYDEVQSWMFGRTEQPAQIAKSLAALNLVFGYLLQARARRGQLSFEDTEAKLVVREDGEYTLGFEERTDAHKFIEELMLLANHVVAKHLKDTLPAGLFRHQAVPESEEWAELMDWAEKKGLAVEGDTATMPKLADLLVRAHEQDGLGLKTELRVRGIMESAIYTTENASHFSLDYSAYTHFTSPIRRLADLLVHRLLLGEDIFASLEALAATCSDRSRGSRMAERYVWDRLKKRVMNREEAAGQILDAHVVSSSKRGLRVVVPKWQTSALVNADALVARGCTYDIDLENWVDSTDVWEPGHLVKVRILNLEDANGVTELYVVVV